MLTSKRPIAVVRNVLLTDTNELLLGLRADCLKWELPGGKIEDETVADGGRREQFEETGIVLDGEPLALGYSDVALKGERYVDLFLVWEQWSGFPCVMEDKKQLKWHWFPLDNLPEPEICAMGTDNFIRSYLPILVKSRAT